MTTLNEDFDGWWVIINKYQKIDIPARTLYGDVEIKERFADYTAKSWPGSETNVKYYVLLENGVYVGFNEIFDPVTNRRARYHEFPIYDPNKSI